jgi:catechol 2,3-dioxygenase-like lactoylglutathione lyase family enzyme
MLIKPINSSAKESAMQLEIRRIILFTSDMAGMTRFYRDVLGLKPLSDEDGWKEFSAGACNIAGSDPAGLR